MASITGDDGSSAPVYPGETYGVWGQSATDAGVIGTSRSGEGVLGKSSDGLGVLAYSYDGNAVEAYTYGGNVTESPGQGIAVVGSSNAQFGIGIYGRGPNVGVAAVNWGTTNAAYLAGASTAGWFAGPVVVTGVLFKPGGGFLIDHPTDPGGKLLAHSFVESSDMKNLYDGIAILDENGAAEINLPAWFEALNGDFRYQLTALGKPAPNLHVSQEVTNGAFRIAGGPVGAKVCWQVTGVRRDTWAMANPLVVEQLKSQDERGHFLHPELRGQSSDQGIGSIRHPLRPPKRS